MSQQRHLGLDPATRRKTAEVGGPQDSVTWDKYGDRVGAAGLPNRLGRASHLLRNLSVRSCVAKRDCAKHLTECPLKCADIRCQRQIKRLPPSGKVIRQLGCRLSQKRIVALGRPLTPVQ